MKQICKLSLLFLLFGAFQHAQILALDINFNARVTINKPTAKSIRIIYWSPRTPEAYLPPLSLLFTKTRGGIPDSGLEPGESSWTLGDAVLPPGNVGFTAVCLTDNPERTKLRICVQTDLTTAEDTVAFEEAEDPSFTIPFTITEKDSPFPTPVFGYTVKRNGVWAEGFGSGNSIAHSRAGTEISFYPVGDVTHNPYYGAYFEINNTLKIPPNTKPGIYYTNLILELYE